jgi:WD40 repeat protein
MPSTLQFPFGAFVVEAAFVGKQAVFALGDGSLRWVDNRTARKVGVHAGAILSATPTRDGKGLVSGGDDGTVAVVEADGNVIRLAHVEKKWIDHVAAGPDGAVAFAAGKQVFIRLGDGREKVLELDRAAGGLAFAPKGTRLAVASYDAVTLWWAGTDAPPVKLAWKGAHLGVTFSLDNRFVISSMQENALHGWRLEDSKDMRMSGYPAKTRSMAWTSKGRFLATSGANSAVLWPFQSKDGPMGKQPTLVGGRSNTLVTRIATHPRDEKVAMGYQDGMIILADIADGKEVALRKAGGGPVSALNFDRTGGRLIYGTEDGSGGIVTL